MKEIPVPCPALYHYDHTEAEKAQHKIKKKKQIKKTFGTIYQINNLFFNYQFSKLLSVYMCALYSSTIFDYIVYFHLSLYLSLSDDPLQ